MKKIPVYEFDCSLPPEKRWDALPKYMRTAGRTLARRGIADVAAFAGAVDLVGMAFRLLSKWRNPYRDEAKGAAKALGIPYNDAVALNFMYEASQLVNYGFDLWENGWGGRFRAATDALRRHVAAFRKGSLACTAGARMVEGLGMVHARALDWPVQGLGRHTVVLRHVNAPAGEFLSIGWPGYSGVLSGVRLGAFSATINQAPVLGMPNLQWPPSHLLRYVFENCRTYAEALAVLRDTPVCFPAFVLLAGPVKAAVVELCPDGNTVKHMQGKMPIVVANDYLSAKRRKLSGVYGMRAESDHRRNLLLRRLRRLARGNLRQALDVLGAVPVENDQTMQQMVFAHGSGAMMVVGREDDEAVAETSF